MTTFNHSLQAIAVFGLSLGLVVSMGCGENAPSEQAGGASPSASQAGHEEEEEKHTQDDGHTEEGHAEHPTEGPHQGGLVELGEEEYHIEIVHDDDAGTVTAYVLDTTAKIAVPIEATEILVNLSHDGKAEQFALGANPQSGDPEGKSSRFVSSEAELAEDLDNEAVKAQLVVTINGKQYRVSLQHSDEGHESHAEESGDHDEHGDEAEEDDKTE